MPGKHVKPQQVKLYMSYKTQNNQCIASAKAGFSSRTARRIDSDTHQPAGKIRKHRTRKDPLHHLFEDILVLLLFRE